ncbi:MAG: restriction endonuclease [Proteobacteria bacterium]|nr:restriction endonuclease [Pseudomonadota bacterium]
MTINLDSSARLLHEAIQQMGWSSDPALLVDRVKRLDLGLPAEDEFIFILSWLGKCALTHKLDQSQFPPRSKDTYQVPDLLASFQTRVGPKLVLIEIKVTNKQKLKWKADYFGKLKRYSDLLGIPLLVAWKFYGLWLLVDIECFQKATSNFHLSLETAMKNNLMSFLAGDFGYVFKPNVGLHFVIKKDKLVDRKATGESSEEQQWLVRIEKAYFTNSEGVETTNLPSGLWPLFISAGPEAHDKVELDYIYQRFVIPDNNGIKFAHTALPILLNFSNNEEEKIHWRKQLEEHHYPVEYTIFCDAAKAGIERKFVQYIFHVQPFEIPSFLKELKITEQGFST